jgi:hypothetical protein
MSLPGYKKIEIRRNIAVHNEIAEFGNFADFLEKMATLTGIEPVPPP